MRKYLSFGLAVLIAAGTNVVKAEGEHQSYALDKLANAQAQLERLKSQRKALNQLIKAVKKDLRAAKVRARAERIQMQANTARQDAAVMVEQTGVAIDLPNLMTAKGVEAGILEYDQNKKENIDKMFKDKQSERAAVYFPDGKPGKKIEPSNPNDLPDYIK